METSMSHTLSPIVQWHFKFFRFLCFCPISLNANAKSARNQEILCTFWNLFVFVSFNVILFFCFSFHDVFSYSDNNFGFYMDCIKLYATSLTTQISLLEPIFQKGYERAFWAQFFGQSPSIPFRIQVRDHKSFLYKFYLHFITNQIIEAVVLLSFMDYSPAMIAFWTLGVPYMYFLKFRSLKLIFCLHLITLDIRKLNKDLLLLVEFIHIGTHRQTSVKYSEFIRIQIREKQRAYENIFETIENLKSSHGLLILANYFKFSVRALVTFYWLYWECNNLAIKDLLLIPAILEIPMFLLTAKSVTNAAKYISYRVHNLKHSPQNVAVSVQIQNFSLQLLHQKIKIDGLGIASMDGYMLMKAIGSITTYMVFFIQFMPKLKSKFD